MDYLRDFWKDPFLTEGKCSQKEFATIYWISIGISFIPFIGWIYAFLFIIPSFCLAIRRFHDLGLSSAYFLTLFIPILNFIMILSLTFAPGKLDSTTPNAKYTFNTKPTKCIPQTDIYQFEESNITNIHSSKYTNSIHLVHHTTSSIQLVQHTETNSITMGNDLMDIMCEDTINLCNDVVPNISIPHSDNITTLPHNPQIKNIKEPTSNYEEKDLIDIILDFFKGDNSNIDTANDTTDNTLSPEETDTLLTLSSFVLVILSILFFKWPASIYFELLSIVCGSIPLYHTYKKSHSIPLIPLICIMISFFLFLIRL